MKSQIIQILVSIVPLGQSLDFAVALCMKDETIIPDLPSSQDYLTKRVIMSINQLYNERDKDKMTLITEQYYINVKCLDY